MRMEPPPSVPRCSVPRPNAAATPAPPLLPPDVKRASHGLRVTPVSGLSVTAFQPNSDVVVFPKKTAPCRRIRATGGPSSSLGTGLVVREPRRVGIPFTRTRSLTVTGNPSRSSARFSTSPPFFRRQSVAKCALAIGHNESIVEAIEPIDSIERRGYDLNGRHAFRTIERDYVCG